MAMLGDAWPELRPGERRMVPAAKGPRAKGLVAEAGADGNAFAPDGTAAAQHGGTALGLHAGAKAVCLDALAAIGLKRALGHKNALLSAKKICALTARFKCIAG